MRLTGGWQWITHFQQERRVRDRDPGLPVDQVRAEIHGYRDVQQRRPLNEQNA
jgi:hypothetical protein